MRQKQRLTCTKTGNLRDKDDVPTKTEFCAMLQAMEKSDNDCYVRSNIKIKRNNIAPSVKP